MNDSNRYVRAALQVFVVGALSVWNSVSASQSFFVEPSSIVLRAHVDYYDIDVIAAAATSETNGGSKLSELYVSYGDVVVNVPNEITRLIVNPDISSLRMTYCGTAKIIATDKDGKPIGEGPTEDPGPCLGILLSYREGGDATPDEEHLPYVSIDILHGKIFGYGLWRYDGSDWDRDEYRRLDDSR